MKQTSRFLLFVLALMAVLLSACGGAAAPATSAGGDKVQAETIAFTGVLESVSGDQWVVSGKTIKVDQSVLRDGPFNVGDTVKVEGSVSADGSITAARLERPSADDLSAAESQTPAPVSTVISETPIAGGAQAPLVFDDSGNEAFGTVESIDAAGITIGGETFSFLPSAEIKGLIQPGDFVKIHLVRNADGTFSVREVEISDPSAITNANGNDNSNSNGNSNDDNGNDGNSNDDNGNGGNSNDDNGNGGHDDNGNGGGGGSGGGGGDDGGGNGNGG